MRSAEEAFRCPACRRAQFRERGRKTAVLRVVLDLDRLDRLNRLDRRGLVREADSVEGRRDEGT